MKKISSNSKAFILVILLFAYFLFLKLVIEPKIVEQTVNYITDLLESAVVEKETKTISVKRIMTQRDDKKFIGTYEDVETKKIYKVEIDEDSHTQPNDYGELSFIESTTKDGNRTHSVKFVSYDE